MPDPTSIPDEVLRRVAAEGPLTLADGSVGRRDMLARELLAEREWRERAEGVLADLLDLIGKHHAAGYRTAGELCSWCGRTKGEDVIRRARALLPEPADG